MRRLKGFSLLEILIAFAIMAVALTIVLRIFGSGVNNAVIMDEYNLAVQIAESLMARTGIETPLAIGETTGNEGGKYNWQVTVRALVLNNADNSRTNQSANNQAGNNPGTELFSVKVLVFWEDDGDSMRSIELNTLKTL